MSKNTENENNTPITEYEWMIRPCEMYREEYNDCRSVKGRFHQYFIHGETKDCGQWKKDFDNCSKWKDANDLKAANEVLESEKERRKERLKAHYANNVWEKRNQPPEEWSKPLPEWISKDYEHSYLGFKAKEMRGEATPESILSDRTLCVIM
ncbi:uncharacterized protein CBL_00829 [Carabus blaptoides fortunei]